MRILIIANSESFHTARFANAFTDLGHEVVLLSATPYLGRVVKYDNVKHIEFFNVCTKLFSLLFPKKIKRFNPEISKAYHPFNFLILFRMLFLFFFINRLLRKEKFEAVFATNLTTNGLFAAKIKRDVSKVCSTLGCDIKKVNWKSPQILTNNKFVYKYVYSKLTYIVTGKEQHIIDFFSNKKLFPNFPNDGKLFYINGLGVDFEKFSPSNKSSEKRRELYGLDKEDILSICFRQPRPILDFEQIILSVAEVVKIYPNFYFAIGTGGRPFPELEEIAINKGIKEHILFMDNISYDELHNYIAQGDIYIDPINIKKHPASISAGISGSLLESMSCGLIPVVGNRPGLEFFFDKQHYDFVYEGMKEHLSTYIIKAIQHKDNMVIKDSFRNIVIEKSSWQQNIFMILSYLQKK